jgi:large subunit ribosomal protein L35
MARAKKIKMKTHKGALKRFTKTAGGIKRRMANRNHILTKRSRKAKRNLKGPAYVAQSMLNSVKRLLRLK